MSDDDVFIEEIKIIADGLEKEGLECRRYHFSGPLGAEDPVRGQEPLSALVSAADTLIELGHPVTVSVCLGLVTKRGDLVADGRVTTLGKELKELSPGRHSFALIALAEAVELNVTGRQTLVRKLPAGDALAGCMVRVMSDRIWVRMSQEALNRGLSLETMGRLLVSELKKGKDRFNKVEVLLAIAGKDLVGKFRFVADRIAERNLSRYKAEVIKRADCTSDVDCGRCPDSAVCQVFKDVVMAAVNKEGESIHL